MRLSVCLPCFYNFKEITVQDAVRKAAALGYDAVEMWKAPEDLDPEAVAAACRECGVTFAAMCTNEFHMTADGDIPAYLEGLKSACETAKRMGVKKLISQVGPDTGAPREQQHANIVRCLKEAAKVLEAYDVMLVIEPLNVLVNHKGYYLWSAVEGFDIIREVGHPLVRLLFDIYHQQVSEGNIIANVTGNIDLVGHLHSAGCPGRHELQTGENDYRRIFEEIDKAGYTGVCALEYKPLLPPEESLAKTLELYGK